MTPNPSDSNELGKNSESQPLISPCSSSLATGVNADYLLPYPDIIDAIINPAKHGLSSNRSSVEDIPPSTKVYKRRWWILTLFSLLSFLQSWVWITYSSITFSAIAVYGWSDTTIALLIDWGNVPFLLLVIPFSWLLHKKGLRFSTVISAVLIFCCAGLKCFDFEPEYATPVIHVSQLLNGIAGIVFNGAPAHLSSVWFPSHQRTTATSIAILTNTLGIAFGYFIGPVFVPHTPDPECHKNNWHEPLNVPCLNNATGNDTIEDQKDNIQNLMYFQFGVAAILLFALLLYFPSRPPRPPTASAILQRLQLKSSILMLIRNKNFWYISLGFSITSGICGNWLSVLGPALKPFGVSQNVIGFMGTASMLAGILLSLVMARIVDLLGGRIKMFLVIMWMVGCVNFIWYTLLFLRVITPTLSQLYPTVIITGIMAYSGSPLYLELVVEEAYPIHEGVVGILVQGIYNFIGSIFLGLFLIPNIGISWMNWCLIGSTVFGVALALLQKETYNRSDIDKAARQLYVPIEEE